MLFDFIKQFNWIDIITVVVFARVIYISIQTGFMVEFFKLLGTVVLVFVCFHYYTPMTNMIISKTSWPSGIVGAVIFSCLWGIGFFLCKLMRDGIFLLFTIQAQAVIDQWVSPIVAVFRAWIVASMVLFLLLVIQKPYLDHVVMKSFSKRYIVFVAGELYQHMTEGVVTRIFPNEKVNEQVVETLKKVRAK